MAKDRGLRLTLHIVVRDEEPADRRSRTQHGQQVRRHADNPDAFGAEPVTRQVDR
jgi:hypothetical protein